jgi:parallel beta-helix repeat protein
VPPGGRIQVEPGLYAEALVLDKPVEIVGVGNAEDIVVEAVGAACVLMHTERAAVRGITLRCSAGLGEKRYYAVNIPAGQLLLEDCHISSNSLAAVAIHGRSALPTIRRCSIRNGGERALVVYGHGAGLIEGCDIYAATICVRISNHATPTMRRCRIHGGKHGGVSFVEHAQGTLEECDIVDNGHHGVSIRQNSNPVIRRCRIQRNGWTAISVADTSGATVERCDLSGNRSGAWEITEYARLRVLRRDNKEL